MLVCICHGITDRDLRDVLQEGAVDFKDICRKTGVGTCCGNCARFAREFVVKTIQERQPVPALSLAYEVAC